MNLERLRLWLIIVCSLTAPAAFLFTFFTGSKYWLALAAFSVGGTVLLMWAPGIVYDLKEYECGRFPIFIFLAAVVMAMTMLYIMIVLSSEEVMVWK